MVQHLQRAVFGEGSMRQGFVQCVYLATLAQVRRSGLAGLAGHQGGLAPQLPHAGLAAACTLSCAGCCHLLLRMAASALCPQLASPLRLPLPPGLRRFVCAGRPGSAAGDGGAAGPGGPPQLPQPPQPGLRLRLRGAAPQGARPGAARLPGRLPAGPQRPAGDGGGDADAPAVQRRVEGAPGAAPGCAGPCCVEGSGHLGPAGRPACPAACARSSGGPTAATSPPWLLSTRCCVSHAVRTPSPTPGPRRRPRPVPRRWAASWMCSTRWWPGQSARQRRGGRALRRTWRPACAWEASPWMSCTPWTTTRW